MIIKYLIMNNLQHTDNARNGIEILRIITDKTKKH
jgi:hypothetical protein